MKYLILIMLFLTGCCKQNEQKSTYFVILGNNDSATCSTVTRYTNAGVVLEGCTLFKDQIKEVIPNYHKAKIFSAHNVIEIKNEDLP